MVIGQPAREQSRAGFPLLGTIPAINDIPMPLTDDDYITLPTSYLVEVICHCPPNHLWEQEVRSRHPGVPDFTPRVVRYDLGALLKAKDPDETFVKVFLYPDTHHAEVWMKSEWDQSNTKSLKAKLESAAYQEQESERLRKWDGISTYVETKMGIDKKSSTGVHVKMVKALLGLRSVPEQLKSFDGIEQALRTYGNLS